MGRQQTIGGVDGCAARIECVYRASDKLSRDIKFGSMSSIVSGS